MSPVADVARLEALATEAVFGPLISVHVTETITAPLFPFALPLKATEFVGKLMVCEVPASTVGGMLAAFTVTVTVEVEDKPLLSVAISWNVYTPCTRSITAVDKLPGELTIAIFGPLASVQETDEIVAPPLPLAVPVSVTEFNGRVMVWLGPALTVGGIFAGFTVTVTVEVLDNPLLSLALS